MPPAAAVEWGPLSDWFAGIATSLAVAVALVFSLRAERMQRESELAAVYAWFELSIDEDAHGSGVLWVINNTATPIYEWLVTVGWVSRAGDAVALETGHAALGLLPPGRHDFVLHETDHQLPDNDATVSVDLRFRDASGRERRRSAS